MVIHFAEVHQKCSNIAVFMIMHSQMHNEKKKKICFTGCTIYKPTNVSNTDDTLDQSKKLFMYTDH